MQVVKAIHHTNTSKTISELKKLDLNLINSTSYITIIN